MSFVRLATLAAASFLFCVSVPFAGNAAIAAETYAMTTLGDEGRSISAVAFSQDGARIVFAADDRAARIRETAAGSEISLLKLDGGLARSAAFSPDGTRVVTVSGDNAVRVWDVPGGDKIASQKPPGDVHAAAFSPDGTRIVIACADGNARIFDLESGREIAVLEGHTSDVLDAAFSPDGARVVTASRDKTARVWDVASAREVAVLDHPETVNSVAFSPDGMRLVTGSNDDMARVFDSISAREIAVLKGHDDDVLDAHFSPDGARIVTASYDRSARIWDAGGAEEIAVLTGHLAAVYSAAFSPDGARVFTAARDATGRIWTKLAAASLPEGVAGLWYENFTAADPMPEEIVRHICLTKPGVIRGDGLIVNFEGFDNEPPKPILHMRCTVDLICQIFAGAPAQGLEPQATATLSFANDTGSVCVQGECTAIARCPALVWTDDELKSGFADAWEARVLAPEK
jgi:sugar lactone lactonase YvrE